jgi:hypothetical protein
MFIYVLALLLLSVSLFSQQAIVNMPSADVATKGEHFLMHEAQIRSWRPGNYLYGTSFYTYGVGKNTELAVTAYNTGSPLPRTASMGFGYKTALPFGSSEKEQKLTFGNMYVQNLRGKGAGHFSYAHYSFRLPRYHTRITAGGFAASRQLIERNTGNVMLALEHPIKAKKLYFLTEWFGGRHDFGFVIPGILYHPTPRQVIVVAYKIPNYLSNGRHGLVLEYGFYFGGKKEGH